MNSRRRGHERGSALLFALVMLMLVSSIGTAAVTVATLGRKAVHSDFCRETAAWIAEAGIEKALVEIVRDRAFVGEHEVAFGGGSFSTQVRAIGEDEREITSVGHARRGASLLFRHRVVARVQFGPDRGRIIGWSASSLPVEVIGEER